MTLELCFGAEAAAVDSPDWATLRRLGTGTLLLVSSEDPLERVVETPAELAELVRQAGLGISRVAVGLSRFLQQDLPDLPVHTSVGLSLVADLLDRGEPVVVVSTAVSRRVGAQEQLNTLRFVKQLFGLVPASILTKAAAGSQTRLRALHARLHGDEASLAAWASRPEEAAALRRGGCTLYRPVRRGAGDELAVEDERLVTDVSTVVVDWSWHAFQLQATRARLQTESALKASDTCIICGNGPSLATVPRELFRQGDLFISNFAAMSPFLLARAKCLTVTNSLVAEQGAEMFNCAPVRLKVAPTFLAHSLHEGAGWSFVRATGESRFLGEDPATCISWAATVTFFNLQLAYYLGYSRVILVGIDNSYVQPAHATDGAVVTQDGPDENHFDSHYFRGRRWQAADTGAMREVYHLASGAFQSAGRELFDLTGCQTMAEVTAACSLSGAKLDSSTGAKLRAARIQTLSLSSFRAASVTNVGCTRTPEVAKRLAVAGAAKLEVDAPTVFEDYSHVAIHLHGACFGERSWRYFGFKLQRLPEEQFLELRANDMQPVAFSRQAPSLQQDEWGQFARIPLEANQPDSGGLVAEFIGELNPLDGVALAELLRWVASKFRADSSHTAKLPSQERDLVKTFCRRMLGSVAGDRESTSAT